VRRHLMRVDACADATVNQANGELAGREPSS
jgi:hypothetical protein